ncbi:hypothetical protein L596_028202 [Steinernema carpocapsae]|uniref:Protein kinase domain-containing protein n=1 Tax=Steinernema carpocapsae TaxID=34508 RepID=A0A4V5ZY02_STECR|nr:hypothetical protein L596_028202 [Steinernema carpocapsae]
MVPKDKKSSGKQKRERVEGLPISKRYSSWNVEIIGKGTYGLVRLASNRYGDRVAIKTVQKEIIDLSEGCLFEHRILEKLNTHQNVVHMLSYDWLPGNVVEMVLEYIPYDAFVLAQDFLLVYEDDALRELVLRNSRDSGASFGNLVGDARESVVYAQEDQRNRSERVEFEHRQDAFQN